MQLLFRFEYVGAPFSSMFRERVKMIPSGWCLQRISFEVIIRMYVILFGVAWLASHCQVEPIVCTVFALGHYMLQCHLIERFGFTTNLTLAVVSLVHVPHGWFVTCFVQPSRCCQQHSWYWKHSLFGPHEWLVAIVSGLTGINPVVPCE